MQIEINQLPMQAQRWFDMAQTGEPIRFVNSGRIVARLALTDIAETTDKTTTKKNKKKRQTGRLAKTGRTLDPAFFEPLDDEELSLFS